MISLRDMRANVWRGLLCASDQEIRDGMDFYPGAHGLCRLLSGIFGVSVDAVAGIYAALSPMNGWYSNVANVVDVLRNGREFASSVNTTNINHWKALAILHGTSPEVALGAGRKVQSFYRGIANPDDPTPIPVDRHLICLAVGRKITNSQELRGLAGDRQLYDRVERVYRELGQREGLGNRLAAIAWFVQRRIQAGQVPIPHPDSPFCCGAPMTSHGHKPRRFICSVCHKSRVPGKETPEQRRRSLIAAGLRVDPDIDVMLRTHTAGIAPNGRPVIYLPLGHRYGSRQRGQQWLSRFVVMHRTRELLRRDEHVHHENGALLDCRSDNLGVMLDIDHGRLHARKQLLYMLRDRMGRWAASDVPAYSDCLDDVDPVPF